MSQSSVILDTDFLSSFLKIDQLALVRDFYQVERLLVPPAVYRELSQTSLLQKLAEISWLRVETPLSEALQAVAPTSSSRELGAGETECIALALRKKESVLLISDNRARREAVRHGIHTVDIPAFLLACKVSGFLDRDQVTRTIRALQEKDWYGFRQDVLASLIE